MIKKPLPLILGGHSFISQLGNDPALPPDQQQNLVAACLDAGITWFDTTYQPERKALGNALASLGRRDEATIIAWNFFTRFDAQGELGGADTYQPHHLDLMLDQLKTDRIDCLVVHGVNDPDKQAKQQDLAVSWQEKGLVKALGVWAPGPEPEKRYGPDNPYSFMVQPYNVGTPDAAASFMAARKLGWQTYACSPFIRGWRLDSMVQRAIEDGDSGSEEEIRSRLADQMLRYSLFRPNVDKLIVAIRRIEWVAANAASVARGPLSAEEESSLLALADSVK